MSWINNLGLALFAAPFVLFVAAAVIYTWKDGPGKLLVVFLAWIFIAGFLVTWGR